MLQREESKPKPERFLSLRDKLGLTQQEASELFGVDITTWQGWEYGLNNPRDRYIRLLESYETRPPKIITVPEMCRKIRRSLGLKKVDMAKLFEVQPHSWGYWERGIMKPSNQYLQRIEEMFAELEQKEPLQKAS